MKKDPNATANASAVTVAVFYIVCRLLIWIFPGLMITISQSWFHLTGLNEITAWNLTLGSFILGLFTTTLSAWTAGYIFASFYNYFLKKK